MNMPARKLKKYISFVAVFCMMLLLSAFTRGYHSNYGMPFWLVTYISSLQDSADYGYEENDEYVAETFWTKDVMDYEELDTREEGLELEGRIPVLTQYAGIVQLRINAEIDRVIASKIADARESRSRSLVFSYEAYFSDPYMSIILISTAANASSKTEVISINFDVNTGMLINAMDVVGSHVVQLADRLLVEMIRRNPGRYNPSFAGMRDDQAFSITDEEITFWFNEFQLAPGFEGIVPLSLQLDDIKETTLLSGEYHVREGFNFKMVPIRIVRDLGYTFLWDWETRNTSIFHNGELVIQVAPDVNNFVRESRFTRSLEAAPVIIGTTTYVPLSFFDQILSLVAFSIDDDDNITFASYPVTDEWFER